MKFWSTIFTAVLAATLVMAGPSAEAARLGGGKSFGKQSSNVTQRQAAPGGANSVGNNAANSAAKPAAPAAAPAVQAPRKPWGAMLGGLAAGLGLAWLASSLGLGGAFGQIIMFALLALVVMVVIGFVMRKLKGGAAEASGAHAQAPFAFQGAGNAADATTPRNYSPANVGNDASARPWERTSTAFDGASAAPAAGSMIGSGLLGSQSWGVPAGFDAEGFLKASKANFVTLQDAWDRSDIQSLRAMMTDDMLAQIKTQLADRETHTGGVANKTDVVMLDAQLLGIEELSDVYMASVEFSGMIREDVSAGASPFREVWNMTKPRNGGSGWLVAGVQALQ
ncbi:Tim44 domain-containing protein [Polaromonas jejuensis]|uniref:Tim44 domain-containing protein n=1 Tax=Polaromonas jejuensis TaxID=457502 RepID=A0ABW0Q9H1_9BURK|nr:TIM44-like domain-containing protein [Polaromonas jejuensis]